MRAFRLLLSLVLSLSTAGAMATHNRAGEIIVCHLGGGWYEATIITHTKLSAPADRPELTLCWGDGICSVVPRSNIIDTPGSDLRRNEYVAQHEYLGVGSFILQFDDQNRNGGVVNVPNSISQSFCVQTKLVISAIGGNNCSVRFLNPPIQDACYQRPWIHNSVAYDPDGDSLSYEPVVCLGLNCDPIGGYQYPNAYPTGGGNTYTIDPTNGTIFWLNPGLLGEYNIAFRVHEWRRVGGTIVEMGWVTRDMQVTVRTCTNEPPVIQALLDTCVEAGDFLTFNVNASDPNFGQQVTLTALGQPLVLTNSPATFVSPSPAQSVTGVFSWQTTCSHVRLQPYQMVFNAIDNDPEVQLQDYKTMNITVVAPAPEDPSATPNGSAIDLQWDPSICSNATGYRIYRRSGLYGFTPDHCETGVPAYTGYTFLASTVGISNTNYTDANNLVIGNQYCYMVVAVFPDGAQSYASVEFCAILDRQVPVITKVSVVDTDVSLGIDSVQWSNAFDLDTMARPGPYQFKLYRGTGFTTAGQLVWTSSLHPFLKHPDTNFVDTGLDTQDQAHVYRVLLLGDGGTDTIGYSSPASSVFINAIPNDEQLTIQWTHSTPWQNTLYKVFRDIGGTWTFLGISTTDSYIDSLLVNGEEYCYLVQSFGAYSDPGISAPLINWSQEVCGVPVDLTPPCAPTVVLDNDCETPLNTLTWNNPNETCSDDTYFYRVYYADSLNAPFVLIATVSGAENTVFTHVNNSSVAGCYQVTAVDTVGNESPFVEPVCGDNCPQYTLPNIFTPNSDRVNDFFVPFPYRGVRSIELAVFNRWGMVVFETLDPAIQWNGTLKNSGEVLPDGVYYYVCNVNYARLTGTETMQLKGYVHLQGGGSGSPVN